MDDFLFLEAQPQPQSRLLSAPPKEQAAEEAARAQLQAPAPLPPPAPEPQQPVVPFRVPLLSGQMAAPLVRAYESMQSAVKQQGQAQAEAAERQAAAVRQLMPEILQSTERFQQLMTRADELAEEKMRQMEEARQRVREYRVDPNRLMKTPGNRILSAVAIALSGIGNTLSRQPGAPNQAYEIIQRAIDRDVQEQLFELQKRKEDLNDIQQEYRNVMDMYANKGQKMLALRSLMLDNAAQQLKLAALDAQAPQAKANAEALAAQIELDRAKIDQQLKQQAQAANMQTLLAIEKARGEASQKQAEMKQPLGEFQPTEATLALQPRQKMAAKMTYNRYQDALKMVEKLKSMREKYGSETLPGETKTKMMILGKILRDKLKSLGLSEVADTIDPTSFGFVQKQLDELAKVIRDQMIDEMSIYGYTQ